MVRQTRLKACIGQTEFGQTTKNSKFKETAFIETKCSSFGNEYRIAQDRTNLFRVQLELSQIFVKEITAIRLFNFSFLQKLRNTTMQETLDY